MGASHRHRNNCNSSVDESMKPKKTGWRKRLAGVCRHIIAWVKVWLGLAVWAKVVYNRPKHRLCVFHGCQMKRVFKTELGAVYYCRKGKHRFHLEGGATRIIPDLERS